MFGNLVLRDRASSRPNTVWPREFGEGFFEDFLRPVAESVWPAVELREYQDRFVLSMDLPGVEEKEIRVQVVDGRLTIEASREAPQEEPEARVLLNERTALRFKRSFALGEEIRVDDIEAVFRNGVLTLTLPKSERARPRVIPITVKSR